MKGEEQGRGSGIHFHFRLPQLENVNPWRDLENVFRPIWENGKGKAKGREEAEGRRKGANNERIRDVKNSLSVVERAMIGAGAGGIAGAFTYVCLYPLDTVKTKLQMRGASQLYGGLGSVEVMGRVLKEDGIGGLYSGVSAVLVGSTISSAIYFGTCEFAKAFLASKTALLQLPSLAIPPLAGALGNVVSSTVMVPKELITQRMQAGAAGRSWQVLLATIEREGIRGLYAGYSATILRNLPTGVLSFSSFEYLKAAVLSKTKKPHLEPFQSVCCGALAGAISAFLTTPLDVVKTRLMTQGIGVKAGLKSEIAASAYKGFSSTIHQIWREEGWLGLTRGIGPRVLHSSCFAALGYFAFETARLTILQLYLARNAPPALPLEADTNRD